MIKPTPQYHNDTLTHKASYQLNGYLFETYQINSWESVCLIVTYGPANEPIAFIRYNEYDHKYQLSIIEYNLVIAYGLNSPLDSIERLVKYLEYMGIK